MTAALVMWIVFHAAHGWLADTCAGGVFREDVEQAVAFASEDGAWQAIDAAEIERDGLHVIAVRITRQ